MALCKHHRFLLQPLSQYAALESPPPLVRVAQKIFEQREIPELVSLRPLELAAITIKLPFNCAVVRATASSVPAPFSLSLFLSPVRLFLAVPYPFPPKFASARTPFLGRTPTSYNNRSDDC